ncbi:MAG: HAD family hydrolase [Aureispira sp.]
MAVRKLAVFDIDGTLTHTNPLDHAAYIAAVQRFISTDFVAFIPSWFTHFTDSCILIELFERYLNRPPTVEEERHFRAFYIEELQAALDHQPSYFKPLQGAQEIFEVFPEEWGIAFATGCWEEPAHIKLKGGGIPIGDRPLATASDAITRQDVMQTAIDRSKLYYQVAAFEQVVYIGDGLWDRHSCADMGLPFVGIERDNHAYQTGVLQEFHLLADYTDQERFFSLLEVAQAP